MPIAYRVNAEKYLPKTISPKLTGAVKSPCSVFCFFSSLIRRMVNIGIKNSITINIEENTDDISVVAEYRHPILKKNAEKK
jgi:hypothetical protein